MYGSVVNGENLSVWECDNQKQVKYITFNCSSVFLNSRRKLHGRKVD